MPESFKNKHEKVAFDVFEHGIIKRRLLVGQDENADDWKVGHPMVFPYKMWVGGNGVYQMQIRVPIDDTHTWALFYTVHAPRGIEVPEQARRWTTNTSGSTTTATTSSTTSKVRTSWPG